MSGKKKTSVDEIPIATFSGKSKSALTKSAIKETSVLVLLSIIGNIKCTSKNGNLQHIIENSIKEHKRATFLIGDEVYWHNLKGNYVTASEESTLKKQAIALGDDYLNNNLPAFLAAIQSTNPEFNSHKFLAENIPIAERVSAFNDEMQLLNINIKIIRWREWITNSESNFVENQSQIQSLYESEALLKEGIEASTEDFVRRHDKTMNMHHPAAAALLRKRSHDYLLEESPAIFLIAAKLGFEFVAYPGRILDIHKATKEFFITNNPTGSTPFHIYSEDPGKLVNWLEIKFKRKTKSLPDEKLMLDGYTTNEDSIQSSISSPPLHSAKVSTLITFFEGNGKNSNKRPAEKKESPTNTYANRASLTKSQDHDNEAKEYFDNDRPESPYKVTKLITSLNFFIDKAKTIKREDLTFDERAQLNMQVNKIQSLLNDQPISPRDHCNG